MSFEIIFLVVVAILALLIVAGMIIAALVVMRKSSAEQPASMPVNMDLAVDGKADTPQPASTPHPTHIPTPIEDVEAYLTEKRGELAEFELTDLSTSFKGSTHDSRRSGIILHLTQPETPLIAFTSQAYSSQNGAITAETKYGKMELVVAQGKAGVQWQGTPLGILEFGKQRLLGAEGQLLGSLERPATPDIDSPFYPVSIFGQKIAEVNTQVNALSTLRWISNDETEMLPAFKEVSSELDDTQTLLLLSASLLEVGFFSLL